MVGRAWARGAQVVERAVVWARRHGAALLTGLAFCFLWPYYQRSFYRVTLFYQLGEQAGECFVLLAVAMLAAWVVVALRGRAVEGLLDRQGWAVPVTGAASLVATAYLSGAMVPAVGSGFAAVLDVTVTLLFALCLVVVSAAAVAALMRVVYEESLFAGVLILVGGALVARLVSPSFLISPLSTGFVPVCGVAVASLCLWGAERVRVAAAEYRIDYLPFSQAPHKSTWLIPLVAYACLALLHAVGFLNDATTEMHTADGNLLPAPFSAGSYGVYLIFALLFIAASVNGLRPGLSSWRKSTFWVAAMGMAVGLFCGTFFVSLLSGVSSNAGPSTVITGGTTSLLVLLAVTVLFMTYQNRLAPLFSFGLFFFGVYALEKVLTYGLFPLVLTPILGRLNAAAPVLNAVLYGATLAVLVLFLVQLCRTDALLMLFSDGGAGPEVGSGSSGEVNDSRAAVCTELARIHGLTRREADILRSLSQGHTARHIADALCISERTVQTHAQNVYRKLGVHTRQEVIDLVGEKLG